MVLPSLPVELSCARVCAKAITCTRKSAVRSGSDKESGIRAARSVVGVKSDGANDQAESDRRKPEIEKPAPSIETNS